jgi:glycerol kinase
VLETTSLGAACLAGLAVGVWSGPGELEGLAGEDRRFEPQMPHSEAEALTGRWREAVERSRGWEQPEGQ